MEPSAPPRAYRFGPFELDPTSGELRRKGLKVRLRGRPIDILILLIRRQGELVSRDDLRTQLWQADTFVDFDHGLNSAMNKLREALGDTGGNSRYIETVPRRGYRFIAPVEPIGDRTPTQPADRSQPAAEVDVHAGDSRRESPSTPAPGFASDAGRFEADTQRAAGPIAHAGDRPTPSAAASGKTPGPGSHSALAPPLGPDGAQRSPGPPTNAAADSVGLSPTWTSRPAAIHPDAKARGHGDPGGVPFNAAADNPRLATTPTSRPAAFRFLAAIAAVIVIAGAGAIGYGRWHSAAAANGRVMLVVLPFDNVGGPGQDFFSDGITDEMITQLGSLDPQRLGVIARTTAMQYRHSSKNVMDIGRELNVDYLLEGSVRRDAEHVRITAQLIDVHSQTQLWTEAYERDLKDVLMLQRDVGMRLAKSLAGGVLSPVLARQPEPATPQFAAYELVLKARSLRQQATEESAWQCVATFEEAVRIDPNYAPAHAGLADCYRLLGAPGWEAGPPRELFEQARRAAERAIALDPKLGEGYAARSMVRFNADWDLAGASQDLDHAMALNPNLARAYQYKSALLVTMGRFDDAVDAARRGQELDPLSSIEQTTLGIRLYYARRYPEAIDQFTRTFANSNFGVTHWGLGETYRELGRHAEAIPELTKAVQLSNNSPYMRAWLAHGLAAAGRRDEALAIRHDLERLANERYVSPFLFALMASGLGEREQTLSWLEKTFDARSGWMPFVPVEPEFQWLSKDPAFLHLVARVRAPAT
jgi:TolB-like protein/DNA-binding winged helix-turn-helix (wHTH) protein/tetratricopeptide (TPR) repeat protein